MDEEDDSKGVHCEWLNEGDMVVTKQYLEVHSNCISKEKVRDAIMEELDIVPHFKDSLLKRLDLRK